ncbi:MAG: transglutaminase-like domain-containing protein [Actinomycetota bacterium]
MNPAPSEFFGGPGRHTDISSFALDVADVTSAVEVVQGILIYDLFANDLYGVDLPPSQAATVHQRNAASVLAAALEVDARDLRQPRAPEARVGGRCHTYSLLTVALLRAAGVPARSRCGFATYFVPDYFEDHWIAEYWDERQARWIMVDAQLDPTWRRLYGLDPMADVVTVTSDQFLTGGQAWRAWRAGELDADRCGLTSIPEHGAFWIAQNLRLDLAALNKVEMLPWDIWGLHWEPSEEPTADMLDALDAVAELTTNPDDRLGDLRDRYQTDPLFHMTGSVFSVALGEQQQV